MWSAGSDTWEGEHVTQKTKCSVVKDSCPQHDVQPTNTSQLGKDVELH